MDPKRKDVLDSILDSMAVDDTMEKKINEFSRTKQRRKRIERARETSAQFTQTYSNKAMEEARAKEAQAANEAMQAENEMDDIKIANFVKGNVSNMTPVDDSPTQTIIPGAPAEQSADPASGKTMVFNAGMPENPSSQTVVMSEEEIQNLLEEDEPLLKREYVQKGSSVTYEKTRIPSSTPHPRPSASGKISWKIPAAIIGTALTALLLFGGFQFFTNWMQQQASETSVLKQKAFDKVMDWVNQYGALSEEDRQKIGELESFYNRLDDSQKQKINEQLERVTGKTFDELLALAKAADKQDSTNNNTEIAAQKAKLKDQISSLESQKETVQASLNAVQNTINNAYQDYQDKNQAFVDATNAYNAANQRVIDAQNALKNYSPTDYSSQIASLQSQLDSLVKPEGDDADKQAEYEAKKADLQAQITDLQNKQQSADGDKTNLQNELNAATADLTPKKDALNAAQSALNSAKESYESVKGSDSDLVDQINNLQGQIDSLQNQLNSLN